jgi:hypothetical protein
MKLDKAKSGINLYLSVDLGSDAPESHSIAVRQVTDNTSFTFSNGYRALALYFYIELFRVTTMIPHLHLVCLMLSQLGVTSCERRTYKPDLMYLVKFSETMGQG